MTEFEVNMGALKVRVEAPTKEEAQKRVEEMMKPTDRGRMMLGAFGIPTLTVEDVREVKDEPVGMGSEAA